MNRDECIQELLSGEPSEEALDAAVKFIEKGKKHKKESKRLRNKYTTLRHKVIMLERALLEESNSDALLLFGRYIYMNDEEGN